MVLVMSQENARDQESDWRSAAHALQQPESQAARPPGRERLALLVSFVSRCLGASAIYSLGGFTSAMIAFRVASAKVGQVLTTAAKQGSISTESAGNAPDCAAL